MYKQIHLGSMVVLGWTFFVLLLIVILKLSNTICIGCKYMIHGAYHLQCTLAIY